MSLRINPGPYQRSNKSTLKIMLILMAALVVVWACAVIYTFKLEGVYNEAVAYYNYAERYAIKAKTKTAAEEVSFAINAIIMPIVAICTSLVCDVVCTLCSKPDSKMPLGKKILHNIVHNYSWITGLIFALTLPFYTDLYVVIIGSIFATVVVKNLFGGFGKNIFNPAAMARIFVALCFGNALAIPAIFNQETLLKLSLSASQMGLDGVTGATLTTAFNGASSWLATSYDVTGAVVTSGIFADFSLINLAMGEYMGAMGETFTLVILVLGIVLSVLKVINWRTPVFYIGTVSVTAIVIALVCGFNNPLSYVAYHLCLGGLMFGAVFMLTDPVTGPTSNFGKAFIGVFAALITMVIRIKGGYPEGVVYSIALANFISPAIDYFTVGKTNKGNVKKGLVLGCTGVLTVVLCAALGFKVNGGKEVYEINDINRVAYNKIAETIGLKDGEEIKPVENYTIKDTIVYDYASLTEKGISLKADFSTTNVKITTYKLDENYTINSYYEIYTNNVLTAKVYTVEASILVGYHGGSQNLRTVAMVAIDNFGKVSSLGLLTSDYVGSWSGIYNNMNSTEEGYLGKDINALKQEPVNEKYGFYVSTHSYSSAVYKSIVAVAMFEYSK